MTKLPMFKFQSQSGYSESGCTSTSCPSFKILLPHTKLTNFLASVSTGNSNLSKTGPPLVIFFLDFRCSEVP